MQIGDAEDRLVLRLRGDPEADGAEVVAEVELPGWLDAGEDPLSSHYESPRSRACPASENRTAPRHALIAADRGTPSARRRRCARDRKSTRLNSSHDQISYAVFCLKKKNKLITVQDSGVS